MTIDDLLFQAFNRRVIALDKDDGSIQWQWRAPSGQYFTAILVEDDRVYVSSSGYTYCLDALTGAEIWHNDLEGLGTGIPCLATLRWNSQQSSGPAAAQAAMQASSAAASSAAASAG
jgi:outer membrane protein assembly factor BamB